MKTPPYTLSWVEYGSSPERLKVQLLLKDLTKTSVEVSLRIRLKGIGVVIENTPDFYTSSPITLLPGVPVMLSGAMLRENFRYENLTAQGVDLEALYAGASLPSGFYQWEITAFLADQRQVSNVGMAMMTVFKNNPPQITFPQNNAVLMNTGFQSINFTWMPRHRYSTNAVAGTVYTFKIYEIPTEEGEETDPNIIVNSGVLPLFSTQSFGTNYTYKPSDPLLVPGRRYVIQVQAADINGLDEFENNGLSEVSTFSFGNPSEAPAMKLCKKPSNFLAEKLDEQSVQLTWQETNSEAPIDYLVSYRTENESFWNERIVADPSLILVQLAPSNYKFKVYARCTYDNKSTFTNEISVILESPKPEESPEVEPQDTYVNTDPEPVTPSEYEPEQTKEPAINVFNTPIKIILDSEDLKNLPDSLQLPKGYEKLGSLPVLSDKPSIEDLKAALQTQKIDCASYLAGYSCGQHDAPAVPSGDIIQVKTGDEIAINSVGFEVVELDGSGNGKGIVKVSMFNNAKFGVEFKGIKVAKGGCVVSGEAILSNVDMALLSEEQRKKLAETYATFNKVLAIADSLAPEIAKTYNSIADLLKDVRAKAKAVIDKIAKNEKPSNKELKDLAKLSETAIEAKKKEFEGLKKQAGADTSKYVASLGTWLVKQDNALACVKTLPSSEPDSKTKKGGPFFDEGSYFGGCDISALTEEEPENNTAFIGVQAIECLTGASLDLAFYYSSIWISMRFDDDIPDDKKPSFGDFEAITHYKDFSWGEAFTSAGISCVGAMLPPFLAPETARKITIGLSVLAGAAEGFATETVKQYEIAEKAIVKQKGKADMMEVVQKIAWKPVIVNAAVGGMITGAVSFLTTSKRFGKLVEIIKKKLKLTDLADTKQGQKIKDYLSGLGQKIPTGRLKSKYGQYLD